MRPTITNNIVLVHMTTMVNHDAIAENPPTLPFQIEDPEHRKLLLDNAKHGADQYDMYRDIAQISFYIRIDGNISDGKFIHLLYCPGQDQNQFPATGDKRTVEIYCEEHDLINSIYLTLNKLGGIDPVTGYATGAIPVVAGWKINTDIWPILVNKTLAAGLLLPDWWMTDLTSRFNTVKGLLDVGNIYSQNVSMAMRRLPALADTLKYWGVGKEFDEPMDIVKMVCDNPTTVPDKVEPYLTGMYEIIKRYYGCKTE